MERSEIRGRVSIVPRLRFASPGLPACYAPTSVLGFAVSTIQCPVLAELVVPLALRYPAGGAMVVAVLAGPWECQSQSPPARRALKTSKTISLRRYTLTAILRRHCGAIEMSEGAESRLTQSYLGLADKDFNAVPGLQAR